jgi:simple sugar transport system permease protein
LYSPGIVAGRGWIALAIVILGNWKPLSIVLSALMFGFLDTFQLQVQGIGVNFPYQILLAMPYVLTIAVLVLGRGKSGEPLSLGKPYLREG